MAAHRIPVVDYLVLEPEPHLVAQRCAACGARFFDRRNACSACGRTEFAAERVADAGHVVSFTAVHRATPDVRVPYVSVLVALDDGKHVKANLLGAEDAVERIGADTRVRLTTWVAGHDSEGTEAVAFGYVPDFADEEEAIA